MTKSPVTVNGVEYTSKVKAAQFLFADGKTVGEATKIVNDAGHTITYQTVFANTSGLEKVKVRRAKYRILKLGTSGRQSVGEIGKRTGVNTSKVAAILRKAGIAIVTKEALAKAASEAKSAKAAAKAEKKATREAVRAEKKATKSEKKPAKKKVARLIPVVEEPVVDPIAEEIDACTNDKAAMAAMEDMAEAGELD